MCCLDTYLSINGLRMEEDGAGVTSAAAAAVGSCSSVKEDDWICGWAPFVFSGDPKLSREVSLEQLAMAAACCHNGFRCVFIALVASSGSGGISMHEMNCRRLLTPRSAKKGARVIYTIRYMGWVDLDVECCTLVVSCNTGPPTERASQVQVHSTVESDFIKFPLSRLTDAPCSFCHLA